MLGPTLTTPSPLSISGIDWMSDRFPVLPRRQRRWGSSPAPGPDPRHSHPETDNHGPWAEGPCSIGPFASDTSPLRVRD